LTERISRPRTPAEVSKPVAKPVAAKAVVAKPIATKPIPLPASSSPGKPDVATVLRPLATPQRPPETSGQPRHRSIDVGAVITRALTAAGLMK
jgi:hypothetical protein